MKAFTAKLKKGGAKIVVGSRSVIPYAEYGWHFKRKWNYLLKAGSVLQMLSLPLLWKMQGFSELMKDWEV